MADEIMTRIVLRHDTKANWDANSTEVLLDGEAGLETDTGKIKFGDGVKTWAQLKYAGGEEANHYEATAAADQNDDIVVLTAAVGGAELHDGDTGVVKRLISGADTTAKYSYTAYVYDAGNWNAMDGNYCADNVYFKSDLIYTAAIGVLGAPEGGSATIASTGKNVTTVLSSIMAKEQQPSKTDPSTSISVSPDPKYVLVGATGTQDVTVSFISGNYTYGYRHTDGTEKSGSGVVATGKAVNDSSSAPAPTIAVVGSNNKATVTWVPTAAAQECKVTGSTTYTGTPGTPMTNLKNESTVAAITDGTATSAAKTIMRSYVPAYYGFKYPGGTIETPGTLTATQVQALGTEVKEANAWNKTRPTTATASRAWQQFFVAHPKTWGSSTPSAKDANGLALTVVAGTDVSLTFGSTTVDYALYYISLAAGYDTTKITLTW